jgi:hypothetical protein
MSYRHRESRRIKPLHSSNHHRKCKSNGGKSNPENISCVDPRFHEAYHKLFGNWDVYKVAECLNQFWIDPKFQLVVQAR